MKTKAEAKLAKMPKNASATMNFMSIIISAPKLRSRWWIALITCAGVALTLRLGFWQMSRAHEKQARHDAIVAQQSLPVLTLPELLTLPHAFEQLHRRVDLQGVWLAQYTVYLDNRPMNGQAGFYVLTPLQLDASHIVLVQRGWVPRNFEDRTRLPMVDTPTAVVTVEGRLSPAPSPLFELSNSTSGQEPSLAVSRIRQNLDLTQFSKQTGLEFKAVVLQTDPASDGLHRDWPEITAGVEKHWGYAFQWFAMAATQVLLYFWFQWIKPSRHAKQIAP
jgi:cytochrome oxidase assembly protein ShyY1